MNWQIGECAVIEDVIHAQTGREVMFVVLEDSLGSTVKLLAPSGLEIIVPASWPERVMPSSISGQKMPPAHRVETDRA